MNDSDEALQHERERRAKEAEAERTERRALDAEIAANTLRTVEDGARWRAIEADAIRLRRIADKAQWLSDHPQNDEVVEVDAWGNATMSARLRRRADEGR